MAKLRAAFRNFAKAPKNCIELLCRILNSIEYSLPPGNFRHPVRFCLVTKYLLQALILSERVFVTNVLRLFSTKLQ
jgi:hypothetical protein